uniref:FAM3 metabolism regulating signaling molecule D n=1 Tax=Panthera leo TaxID=9689 RepID=A0A8C8X6F8_PANLE
QRLLGEEASELTVMRAKCGLAKPCPKEFFAFKISSGAANVVGPTMCFENQVIMSPVKNNVGRGLNIALVNGELLTYPPDSPLHALRTGAGAGGGSYTFIQPTLAQLLLHTWGHPAVLNDETRKLLSSLGSSYAKQLGFRDSWVFLGAKDLKDKSPFEQFLKNNPDTNKYEGWPELLELEGCVPRKIP